MLQWTSQRRLKISMVFPFFLSFITNALSFYWSKMILVRPNHFGPTKSFWSGTNCFGLVQIVLVGSKSFWLVPNHFGRVQIILVRFKLDFYSLIFIIWTCPKWFEPDQNKVDLCKAIGTQQKLFGRFKMILDPKKDIEFIHYSLFSYATSAN